VKYAELVDPVEENGSCCFFVPNNSFFKTVTQLAVVATVKITV
jgi:uncharacterized surface protein with fasciclin (FAS1) repeats